MKRRISKRIIAIGISLCVAFSIMPLSVSAEAEAAAPAVKQNNLWVSTGKTFVNRIYTVGVTTCGSALVRIAGATESEGFQKVASFVNKWICGGNNTGQTLAEIQALCNEILNEVKIVDQHLKEYDAEIENTLQKIQYTEAKNELNQQWSKDIDVYETAGNVGNTLSAYEDYMKAAQLYMDGKTDINAVEKSNAFKEELNTLVAGNEELCSWTWNSTKNQGYPRILSSLITEVELVNASRGLTVKGMMHKDTKLQLNELDKKNDIYQAFKKYAQKTDKQVLYSAEPTLVYEDGQPSAYEGNLNVKLDLSKYRGKGYKVLVYRNNQIEELEIDKQMIASKDVEEMVPFAVLAEKSEISKAVDHIKDTVKTGDNSSVILLFCIVVVAGSVAGGVIYWRKKKAKK